MNDFEPPKKLRCPRCGHPVHTRLHGVAEDEDPEKRLYVTFSCPESYMTDHGRRRCGRPVVLTRLNGKVVAMFPVRWADIAGMGLPEILKTFKQYEVPW